jgi:hypothetical protein
VEVCGITYKDLPPDLKAATNRLRIDCESLQQALAVAAQLDRYIDEHFQSTYPRPNVLISPATLSISIGDVCVWDSESDSSEELTFEYCLEFYRQHIAGLNEIFQPTEAS